MSLALSVQYKKLRYSRTPIFRTRARACFKDVVELLKSMSDVFLSVRVNAALGESILTQMEKTANTLAREELEHTQQNRATTAAATALAVSAVPAAPLAVDIPNASVSAEASTTIAAPASASSAAGTGLSSSFVAHKSIADSPSAATTHSVLHDNIRGEESSAVMGTTAVTQAVSAEGQDFRSVVAPIQPPTTTALFDLSMLDSLGTDIDLFSNFDPSFDLGAVDTALEANLDMGIPQNWAPWSHIV